MDHFKNPRNVGEIPNPDGAATRGAKVCHDITTFHLRIKDGVVMEAKFKTYGCATAIATSSITTEMALGKTVDEAMNITHLDIASNLGGLADMKMHCAELAEETLKAALQDFTAKQTSRPPGVNSS